MKALHLTETLRRQLTSLARSAAPREACGLIVGAPTPEGWRADFVVPSENMAADPAHAFEIDPRTQTALQRALRAEAAGRAVVGCYHSHPEGPAAPSARDAAQAGEAGFVWAILAPSPAGARMRKGGNAWTIEAFEAVAGGGFARAALVTGGAVPEAPEGAPEGETEGKTEGRPAVPLAGAAPRKNGEER